jgi:hypothetical protein
VVLFCPLKNPCKKRSATIPQARKPLVNFLYLASAKKKRLNFSATVVHADDDGGAGSTGAIVALCNWRIPDKLRAGGELPTNFSIIKGQFLQNIGLSFENTLSPLDF